MSEPTSLSLSPLERHVLIRGVEVALGTDKLGYDRVNVLTVIRDRLIGETLAEWAKAAEA